MHSYSLCLGPCQVFGLSCESWSLSPYWLCIQTVTCFGQWDIQRHDSPLFQMHLYGVTIASPSISVPLFKEGYILGSPRVPGHRVGDIWNLSMSLRCWTWFPRVSLETLVIIFFHGAWVMMQNCGSNRPSPEKASTFQDKRACLDTKHQM